MLTPRWLCLCRVWRAVCTISFFFVYFNIIFPISLPDLAVTATPWRNEQNTWGIVVGMLIMAIAYAAAAAALLCRSWQQGWQWTIGIHYVWDVRQFLSTCPIMTVNIGRNDGRNKVRPSLTEEPQATKETKRGEMTETQTQDILRTSHWET